MPEREALRNGDLRVALGVVAELTTSPAEHLADKQAGRRGRRERPGRSARRDLEVRSGGADVAQLRRQGDVRAAIVPAPTWFLVIAMPLIWALLTTAVK